MDIENLNPGASPVIEDNSNEVIRDKDKGECTSGSSGNEERSNNKGKGKWANKKYRYIFAKENTKHTKKWLKTIN